VRADIEMSPLPLGEGRVRADIEMSPLPLGEGVLFRVFAISSFRDEKTKDFDKEVIDVTFSRFFPVVLSGLFVWLSIVSAATAAETKSPDKPKAVVEKSKPAAESKVVVKPKTAAEAVALGDRLREKKEFDAAIEAYTKAIKLDPKCAAAFCGRGRTYGEKGMTAASLADCNKAIELDPKNASAYNCRGCYYLDKDEKAKALADISEAIRLDPKLARAYNNRGGIYVNQKKWEKAIADLTEVIRLQPGQAINYINRGGCYLNKKQYDRAMADYDTAIRLEPKTPLFYELRGTAWIVQGNAERGLADFQTMLRLNPKDPAVTFQAESKTPPAEKSLKHGRRQVEKMLRDRPAMAQYGEKAKILNDWAARKFAGEDLHEEIFWEAAMPAVYWTAEHRMPEPGTPGHIQIARTYNDGPNKGKDRSFEELWRDAVFELNNITGVVEFTRLISLAGEGRIGRREFVVGIIANESRAEDKIRAFLYTRLSALGQGTRLDYASGSMACM
jgi:tetratricopeptide (TPR) repeat protein